DELPTRAPAFLFGERRECIEPREQAGVRTDELRGLLQQRSKRRRPHAIEATREPHQEEISARTDPRGRQRLVAKLETEAKDGDALALRQARERRLDAEVTRRGVDSDEDERLPYPSDELVTAGRACRADVRRNIGNTMIDRADEVFGRPS